MVSLWVSDDVRFAQVLFKVNRVSVAVVLEIKCTCRVDPFSFPWCNLFTVPLDNARDVGEKKRQAEVPICFCNFLSVPPAL